MGNYIMNKPQAISVAIGIVAIAALIFVLIT